MKNSELLTTKRQDLPLIERQRRYVLRTLVQKNECPNCGRLLNFFEGAGLDIDCWDDKPGSTSCRCTACERELLYVVPFLAATGNGGWHWQLVPIDPQE
jgi:hypothetical protein